MDQVSSKFCFESFLDQEVCPFISIPISQLRSRNKHTEGKYSSASFILFHFLDGEDDLLCLSLCPLLRLLVIVTGGRRGCATARCHAAASRGGGGGSSKYATSSSPNRSSSLTYELGRRKPSFVSAEPLCQLGDAQDAYCEVYDVVEVAPLDEEVSMDLEDEYELDTEARLEAYDISNDLKVAS